MRKCALNTPSVIYQLDGTVLEVEQIDSVKPLSIIRQILETDSFDFSQ